MNFLALQAELRWILALLPPLVLIGAFTWPPALMALFPRVSSGQVENALRTPPILLLSVAEVALPPPRVPLPLHPVRSISSLIQLLREFASILPRQHFLYSALLTFNPLLGPSH
ncbi:hypothetical protein CRENBAI_008447 [Crenichthys baileyi]|uniref:Uncharacterized protein n=1 Tax=Crenichthys baileyi TaxID=28760 RepID=A0AAV9RFD3_9TELE